MRYDLLFCEPVGTSILAAMLARAFASRSGSSGPVLRR